MAARSFDYSKWDKIELSDDESDCHPNIDKQRYLQAALSFIACGFTLTIFSFLLQLVSYEASIQTREGRKRGC
jgi:hypothetical protein